MRRIRMRNRWLLFWRPWPPDAPSLFRSTLAGRRRGRRRFLARWADRAEALGWTPRDLFGLMPVPGHAEPSFSRLSRYDETGLIWLLQGRPVVALTEATAAIQSSTGAITIYRRHNKPALGPVGDSLDGLVEAPR